MAKKALAITFLLIASFVQLNAMMFQITTNEPTCIKIKGGHTYVIEYIVSGENDHNVKMEVFDNDRFMMRKENTNDFKQTLKFEPGNASICFSKTDNKVKSISFDCYLEDDPYKEMIDKK